MKSKLQLTNSVIHFYYGINHPTKPTSKAIQQHQKQSTFPHHLLNKYYHKPNPQWRGSRLISEPLHLIRLHQRISLGNGVTADGLEIKRTLVLFRVPVNPAECPPALAHEPGQPHLLVTALAPVRCLWLLRFSIIPNISEPKRRRCGWRRRGSDSGGEEPRRLMIMILCFCWCCGIGVKRLLHCNLRRRRLLLLHATVSVALRAEVHRCCIAEKSTVVGAELRLWWLVASSLVLLGTHLLNSIPLIKKKNLHNKD